MKRRLSPPSIEALESRIAPATIYIGAYNNDPSIPDGSGPPDNPLDTEYRELHPSPGQVKFFTDVSATNTTDPISMAVDPPGLAGATDNMFFLRLSKGDVVKAFTQSNGYQPLISVAQGNVIAFFVNYNSASAGNAGGLDFDPNELTGLALGKNAKVTVAGNVRGDIVTNLDEHGTKSTADDTVDMTGVVSLKQGIAKLSVTGGSIYNDTDVDGKPTTYANVLSGGPINSITIAGTVGSVLAGSAVNGLHGTGAGTPFDFFPDRTVNGVLQAQPGGGGVAQFAPGPGAAGSAISNAIIRSVVDRVEAGSGGFGGKGGALTNVQITADTDGFALWGGYGGNSDAASGKPNGGVGGAVSKIYVAGNIDPTSNDHIVIAGGAGGGGMEAKNGGKGGAISTVFVGFEINNGNVVFSGDLLGDSVAISGGAGGDGKTGGAGGAASKITVRTQTTDEVQMGMDVAENELVVQGGNGGNNTIEGGKAGAGGSVSNADVRNELLPESVPDPTLAFNSSTLIAGGDGGTTTGNSSGAAGGSITNPTLLGFGLQVLAGNGSSGKVGGGGGSVKNTLIVRDDTIISQNITLDAGHGGDATTGKAGNGGAISKVTALSIDIVSFGIDSGSQGDGGTSTSGKGGAGGAVSNLTITDADSGNGLQGAFLVRSGRGGNGATGGGAGGAISNGDLVTQDTDTVINGGDGGSATTNGPGGAGGMLKKLHLTGDGRDGGFDATGVAQAGTGGAGVGKKGTGGAGGQVQLVDLNMRGDAALVAGDGGNGQLAGAGVAGAAAGKGGSVITSAVFATGNDGFNGLAVDGAGILRAGSAGVDGAKPAAGGSVLGNSNGSTSGGNTAGLRALTDLTIRAGDGSHGGAGGSIRGIAYGSTAASLTPTPSGNILVQAGNGSGDGKFAGKGGSLVGISGSVGYGLGTTTTFLAGAGGSASNLSADGGAVSNLVISLGGGPGVLLTVQAGDGGTTASGSKGGLGGSVNGVGVTNLDPSTTFRSVAAGNGGDGAKNGGNGGSITNVDVEQHDIGVRSGAVFGFDSMGGLFAGAGGHGMTGKDGVGGSVSNITADSIAAIVAGRTLTPQLAHRVSDIIVNGDRLLLTRNNALNPDGSYDAAYYAAANFVGAVVDPTLPDAWKFHFTDNNANGTFEPGDTPIDGIVMAETIDQKALNFIPEARFAKVAPSGGTAGFFDNEDII